MSMKNLKELRSDEKYVNVMSYIGLSLFIIFALGFILFFIYGIASAIAFKPLVPIVIFGVSIICLGISLACFGYFYDKKIKKEKPVETKTKTEKVSTWSVIKDFIIFTNIALILVIIGAVLMFTSIGYGSLKKTSWRIAADDFKAANGYYTSQETTTYENYVPCTDISTINIDLSQKTAVVIYGGNNTWVSFKGYSSFDGQIELKTVSGKLCLTDNASPRKHEALDNMFWFIFEDNKYKAQIRIYIPEAYKDVIKIEGDYILAKN